MSKDTATPAAPAAVFHFQQVAPAVIAGRAATSTATLPQQAIDAIAVIHEASIGTASPFYVVPGEDDKGKRKWLRGLRAVGKTLHATNDEGVDIYPVGRKIVVRKTHDGAPVWALGGAANLTAASRP